MPTDFTGKTFGSYQLVAPLGRGGMASVYRGYQQSIDRSVAVKVLPPEFLHDPNFSARFVAEARTLARLTHHSILPLYDFGTANDVPYIIMPLMANGTLAGSILTLDQAIRNVVAWGAASLSDALRMASTTPADLLGRADLGRIAPGCAADLVMLDESLHVQRTLVGGQTAATS